MTSQKNSLVTPVVEKKVKLVPPDGGWGWMVIIGTAISNIFNQSMLSLFSLLYGDALESMGHNTQGAALVLSTMLFVANFAGPIAGAIIKLTTSRFVAVTGACCCTLGIFITAFASNIGHLILGYGVFLGFGLGCIQNSSFVAINSYFKLKKSRAVGLANAGTGVGQTLMPHLVRYLLEHYGFRGACVMLSGLSLHGIAGCMLIQPVELHMKKVVEMVPVDENLHLLNDKHKDIVLRKNSYVNSKSTESSVGENGTDKALSTNVEKADKQQNGNNNNVGNEPKKSLLKKIYDLFDISLLSSPRFINILIGIALSVTSVQNFSMIYPFFLQKVANFDKGQTATCMSAVAGADIAGRLILPIFQDKYKIKARWMLIMTCVWLIVVRQIMAYQTTLIALITMSLLYGFGRSNVIVSRNIAISENCKAEQVPAAVGLGMLTMGIIVPPAGYFLGWIRDFTGSYILCITVQNLLLVIILVTWIPDMLISYMREKKQRTKEEQQIQLS